MDLGNKNSRKDVIEKVLWVMREIPDDVIKFETFRGVYTVLAEGLSEDSRRKCLEKVDNIMALQKDKNYDLEEVQGRYRMTPNVLLTANENNF